MNKIRKTLLVALVFLLTMSASSFAYEKKAEEVSLNRDVLEKEIWNEYNKLDEFQKHYAESPKDAEAMIESIVDSKLQIYRNNSITPRSGQGDIALIYFPEFKQKNSYYCGPASALTAIYGMGKERSISGSTYNAKQDTLADNMGTSSGSGTYVYKMRNELNNYSSEQYNYYYAPTKNDMWWIITGSLLSDNAPILHANTREFSYYGDYNVEHYLTIVFHNSAMDDDELGGMAVMDNHYNDDYYGTHDISLDEAYESIRGRYLIGVSL
ncbi:MAG: hypothetical protein PHT79_11915 [Syntrophomonadaceae bacterium]|nr:hypothetical protein [Syntrophomonadaceae bacterium]